MSCERAETPFFMATSIMNSMLSVPPNLNAILTSAPGVLTQSRS